MSLHPYAPGSHVLIRDEEWLVKQIHYTKTANAIHVVGLSSLVRNKEAVFLDTLDKIESIQPAETTLVPDDSPTFRNSKLYLEGLLRRTPPTDANLYLGHQGALNYAPYQVVPVHTALSALRSRILIADGVGLGKTVEVGMLVTELIKRGRGNRILVVAIKSMLAQFQQELWSRFAIPLVRLDSVGLQRVRAKIPANKNPFYYYNRVIISVDTLKNDAQYRAYLEQAHWDIIVIDECHNVANAGSQRNRLASLLARTCESLILTSATPHNGKPRSFANLMTMLEPTSIADPDNYTAEEIDGLFVRRFKKDIDEQVQANFQTRHIHLVQKEATSAESLAFQAIYATPFSALERIGLLKELLSSPAAAVQTYHNRLLTVNNKLKERLQPENSDRKYKQSSADLEAERDLLERLQRQVAAITPDQFSKYQQLLTLLTELGITAHANSHRLIIFSERIATLKFLQEQLTRHLGAKEGQIEQFHAGLSDQDQQRIVESFGKQDSPIRILIASDAASEGVNLHYHCHLMIHFDIPWSLIRLEQRNGRIDRYGQKFEPHIYYLLTKTTDALLRGDLYILDRLIEKENEAYKNIGDAATILKLFDASAEEEVITEAVAEGNIDGLFADESLDFLALLLGDSADSGMTEDHRVQSPSLFADDIAFAREAFQSVRHGSEKTFPHYPEFRDDRPEFSFFPPEEFKQQLNFLPDEAIPPAGGFRLTTDREAVMRSMEAARKQEGAWPELQLWWELHPIMEWLTDRLLVSFGRNKTPVIQTPHLSPHHALYLVQSILSNRRSQPVITAWFGFLYDLRQPNTPPTRLSLEEVFQRTGIKRTLPSRPFVGDIANLTSFLPAVVAHSADYISHLRRQRADKLRDDLRLDKQKIDRWYNETLARLGREYTNASPKRRVEIDRERQHAQQLYVNRKEWFTDLITQDKPFIRIAAVFVGQPTMEAPHVP